MGMYGNNRHVHMWGENEKCSFCLTCGQVVLKATGKRDPFMGTPMCDPMFPDGDFVEDLKDHPKSIY